MSDLKTTAQMSKNASFMTALLDDKTKTKALEAVAEALLNNKEKIFEANKQDLDRSEAEGLEGEVTNADGLTPVYLRMSQAEREREERNA